MPKIVRNFLVVLVLFAPACWGAADRPLSKDDVTLLLIGGVTAEKMTALIEKRGVDFQMNPDLAKKFHDEGADEKVIEALTSAGERAAAAATARPAPAAGPPNAAQTPGAAGPLPPSPEPSMNAPAQQSPEAPPAPELKHRPGSSAEEKIAEALAPDLSANAVAPAFSVVDISGKKLDFADYKGKVVLLDFWATWCLPCRAEIPDFVGLQNRYRDQGFRVIGISVDGSSRLVRDFYQQNRMNYPVAMVDPHVRKLYGGLGSIPTTLLIGRDGRIYDKVVGAPADLNGFEVEIKNLLSLTGNEPPAKTEVARVQPPAAPVAGTPAQRPEPQAAQPGAAGAATAAGVATPVAARSGSGGEATKPDLSDPSPAEVQHIIQEFAAKEKMFREARNNYAYHQINKIEELDVDGNTTGRYEQDWDILFDDAGKRIEHVTYAPLDTLKGLMVTKEDLDSMRNVQPFVLTTEELPEYEVKYMGHVKVDLITAYVFNIRPREIAKGRQYFQGVVWVDDRDLQIVKTQGKPVPEMRPKKGQFNLFPRFITYREQIDGKFWFPTFTVADDTLYFPGQPVHMKEVIKYTDYKQFKSSSNIRVLNEVAIDPPKDSKKPEASKTAPAKQ